MVNDLKDYKKALRKAIKEEKSKSKKDSSKKLLKKSKVKLPKYSSEKAIMKELSDKTRLVREGETGYFKKEYEKEMKWLGK